MTLASFALAGGSFIFLAFLVAFLLAVMYGLYTRVGSAIEQRPYAKIYGGAPGAFRPSTMSGSADREVVAWTRGTR